LLARVIGHWNPIVRPLLEALEPKVVVEIGAFRGQTTRPLLELASDRGFVVHSIDPTREDKLDPESLAERYGDQFVFHQEKSLDALPRIRDVDAVLLDGDHNWYTVYHELKALESTATADGRPFPLTMLHDIDWPYARRDMYYDPDAIPAEYRHAYDKQGMLPELSELVEEGVLNAATVNARMEGTERNGVRAAVDDVVADSARPLDLKLVPGFFGCGILIDPAHIESKPALADRLAELDSPEWLREQCERLEMARIRYLMRIQGAARDVIRARRAARAG
jgi:hypothetical protein